MYLQLQSINKTFNNANHSTINDLSLDVNEGEFICVVGPSGCGKSTLLNLIAGLEKPTSGNILLNDQPITGPGPDRVVMFQEAALYPWLTVMQNVMFGLASAGYKKKEQKEIAEKYLKMVHLWDFKDYPIHQISGGMKQRTALARSFALDSKILLMDEPFSALDKQTINMLREELVQIWKKTHKTIIYITHSVEEAVYFADRVIVMSEKGGEIKADIPINMPKPRNIDDYDFVKLRKHILSLVGESSRRSASKEYDQEEKAC